MRASFVGSWRWPRWVAGLTAALALLIVSLAPSASAAPYRLVGWGANGYGQVGDGNTAKAKKPVQSGELIGVTAVAAHYFSSMALLEDGRVLTWGEGQSGQMGNGALSEVNPTPSVVEGLDGVTAIATGGFNDVALLGDGSVMAWGGFPGDGSFAASDVPVPVSGITDAGAVAGGISHSVALLSDGTVRTWGGNINGELGDGSASEEGSDVPVEVCALGTEGPCPHGPYLTGVKAVAAGEYFTLALLEDGTVAAWGYDALGELGNGPGSPFIPNPTPSLITGLSGVRAIAAGGNHGDALLSDGTVDEWGATVDGGGIRPALVSGLSGVTAISAGSSMSMALLENGTVVSWGNNKYGQLGDGSSKESKTPVPVSGLSGVAGIAAGADHALAFGAPGPPVLTSFSPKKGPSTGGTPVTIKGAGLSDATEVDFGSTPAEITSDFAKAITVMSPPGTGTVDVTVKTPGGTATTSPPHTFTYR